MWKFKIQNSMLGKKVCKKRSLQQNTDLGWGSQKVQVFSTSNFIKMFFFFFCHTSSWVVSKNRKQSSKYSHLTHSLFNSSVFRLETFNDFFSRNSLPGWKNKKCLYVHMFLTPICYTIQNKKEAMPPADCLQLEILLLGFRFDSAFFSW